MEIFIHALLSRADQYATSRNAKTLTVGHLYAFSVILFLFFHCKCVLCRKHCIVNERQWDFLKELTAKIPDICVDTDDPEVFSPPKRGRQVICIPGHWN